MRVLGVQDGPSPAAALVDDGRLVAVSVARGELGPGGFPRGAVRQVLDRAGVEGCDVDAVAVAGPVPARRNLAWALPGPLVRGLRGWRRVRRSQRIRSDERLFGVELALDLERARFLDHQRCVEAARSLDEGFGPAAAAAVGAALLAFGRSGAPAATATRR